MSAAVQNLSIEAGTTYRRTLRFYSDAARENPMDITGYTFAAWITRDSFRIEFDISLTDPTEGVAVMELAPEQTRDVLPGTYVWDMLCETPDGDVKKHLKGKATIHPTGTRLPE